MGEPLVVPRAEHTISRRQIDPDALKVLYRLHQHEFQAFLVGGSVRDLLLGRPPKDFDIGTSAHPYEVKRLFRNCWIIGRRFRLAHVKFGPKVIEVATFRRKITAAEPDGAAEGTTRDRPPAGDAPRAPAGRAVHRDNTFGTAEEDAFRRDFTLNALFYDIGTFSIIDYTGGLADLQAGLIRCIGDPDERFVEDPVRMLRAVAFEGRLGFRIDAPILASIERLRLELGTAAPARLMEEVYKILRTGVAHTIFTRLGETGLFEGTVPELQANVPDRLYRSIDALDVFRRATTTPEVLTNPVLLGTMLVPLGIDVARLDEGPRSLGVLPLARRDTERLRQLLLLQRRLVADVEAPLRVRRRLLHRGAFRDAITWLQIHGDVPAVVDAWQTFARETKPDEPSAPDADEPPVRRRRRRRRRRPRL